MLSCPQRHPPSPSPTQVLLSMGSLLRQALCLQCLSLVSLPGEPYTPPKTQVHPTLYLSQWVPQLDSRGFINATPEIHPLPLLFGFFLACGLTSNPSAYFLMLSASSQREGKLPHLTHCAPVPRPMPGTQMPRKLCSVTKGTNERHLNVSLHLDLYKSFYL